MKKNLLILILINSFAFAQVGIGNTNPTGALDVSSSLALPNLNKAGFVPPTVSLSATNSTVTTTSGVNVVNASNNLVPVEGTLVYNTNTSAVGPNQVTPGFYFFDGSSWQQIKSGKNNITTINLFSPELTYAGDSATPLSVYGTFFASWSPASLISKRSISTNLENVYYSFSNIYLSKIALNGWVTNTNNSPNNGNLTVHVMKYSVGPISPTSSNAAVSGVSLGKQTVTGLIPGNSASINININTVTNLVAGDVIVCILVNNNNNNRSYEFGGQLLITN